MSNLSEDDRSDILEFFNQLTNLDKVIPSIAKAVSQNMCLQEIPVEKAINLILLHSTSVYSILSRKAITKEMLYKYLTDKNVAITTQVTKSILIDKTIDYWRNRRKMINKSQPEKSNNLIINENNLNVENFPINVMSRSFVNWFFENYNKNTIQSTDFWRDCQIQVITLHNTEQVEEYFEENTNIDKLINIKQKYNLYFNANICHEGVQGRMDSHGLVIVLCCGTLHSTDICVGIFESIFGLSRDPYAQNNWKIRNLRMKLINKTISYQPILEQCQSLLQLIELPQMDSSI